MSHFQRTVSETNETIPVESRGMDSITHTIADTIASLEEVDVDEIEPLYHSIDPEALADLVSSERAGRSSFCRVSFTHEGYTVRVDTTSDLRVTVTPQ